jgi:hypothetical protein
MRHVCGISMNEFPEGHLAAQRWPLAVSERQHFLDDLMQIPLALFGGRANQSRRFAAPGDKNLLSLRDLIQQLRKMRARFVETHGGHIPALLLTCLLDQSNKK